MTARPPLGAFRARLVLEAPVEVADEAGGVRRDFAPVATLWGRIAPVSASPGWAAESPGAVVTHRVTLRARAGLDAAMRLRRGRRLFLIRAAFDPDERGRLTVCLCEEVRR